MAEHLTTYYYHSLSGFASHRSFASEPDSSLPSCERDAFPPSLDFYTERWPWLTRHWVQDCASRCPLHRHLCEQWQGTVGPFALLSCKYWYGPPSPSSANDREWFPPRQLGRSHFFFQVVLASGPVLSAWRSSRQRELEIREPTCEFQTALALIGYKASCHVQFA